jgi:hypothetical protein
MIDGGLFLTDNGRNSVTVFESASGRRGRTIVLRRGR